LAAATSTIQNSCIDHERYCKSLAQISQNTAGRQLLIAALLLSCTILVKFAAEFSR
jgi:hypothetical protein